MSAGPRIVCPASEALHDPGDREGIIVKPGHGRLTRFLCGDCGLRWYMTAAQVRRLIVRADTRRAWNSAPHL